MHLRRRTHRLALYCLLLAAAAFVLQPLAHAEHQLLMALHGPVATQGEDHHQHQHDTGHEHHGHAHSDTGPPEHDTTPMPVCCDCLLCKAVQIPPTLPAAPSQPLGDAKATSPGPTETTVPTIRIGHHLRPPGRAPPLT